MDPANPYAAPSASLDGGGRLGDLDAVATAFGKSLNWLRLLVGVGVLGVGGFGLSVFGMMVYRGSVFEALPTLLFLTIYGLPVFLLYRLQQSVSALSRTRTGESLEALAAAHSSFWRLMGIFVLLIVGFGLLGTLAALLIPMFIGSTG
ncbi:MAG: hypothetical protein AAFU77_10230 [Myxococcota bacterium]